jgi:hypothetical protein
MSPNVLFVAFNIVIIPFWLLLILAPKWIWTDRIVHSIWVPIAIACWAIFLQVISPPVPAGATGITLPGVMLLVGGEHGTLSVWTILMSWDLVAGAWLARDARRLQIHHAWISISLVATYLLGILGLLLYLTIRLILRRTMTMRET